MKYGIKGGKQTNSNAPTICEHYAQAKPPRMAKGDSRSTAGGRSGVQKPQQKTGKY